MTFHRYLSHKSWNPPKWWTYIGSIFGSLALIGSPIAWANNHIAHHKFSDTEKDPHSPVIYPIWKVQWFSMLYSLDTFKYGISNVNKFQIFLHKYYFHLHVLLFIILFTFLNFQLLLALYLVPAAITWNMAGLINTINHRIGYRSYNTNDKSFNNIFTGFFVFGEGWHNNHHRYPHMYKFGMKWWELDIASFLIKVLHKDKV